MFNLQYTHTEYNSEEFANRLKKLVKKKGIPINQFCEDLRIASRATYYSWINGKTIPEPHFLFEMCNYFDVSMDYLLGMIPCEHNEQLDIHKDLGLNDSAIANIMQLRPHVKPLFGKRIVKDDLDHLNDILSSENMLELLHIIHDYEEKRIKPNTDTETIANIEAMIQRKFLNIITEKK